MNITNFFDSNEVDSDFCLNKRCLYNGTIDIWDEMPYFDLNSKENYVYDLIEIEFDTIEEAKEFEGIIGYTTDWDNKTWPNVGKWFPSKDKKRNANLLFIHKDTALSNPDLYEIVSLDEIKP